ncbi:MAG: FAD-dependent oxidoreductase [Actinomycetota bacterium]|nr:FAD-dependent oxidoreductase [Actinomycetota bacterium]
MSITRTPRPRSEIAEEREFEVAVVGLGGIGSGAVYWATKRAGANVLGLERFEFGHERGASQDHSRIIRLSYHKPEYVRFARDAYAAWSDVEGDSGEELVIRTGGIDLYPNDAAIRRWASFARAAATIPESFWYITRTSSVSRHCGQRLIASPASNHS